MSSLAGLFQEIGWRVSGCDKAAVYPPSSITLSNLGIKPICGFNPHHLDTTTDLVIVGNIVRRDNPEDIAARAQGMERLHMAAALFEYFIQHKSSVVVSGTHGKTTCSSLLSFLLTRMGLDPGYFIGGVIRDLGTSYHLGTGEHFIVEGDEYDCAWFDKQPKFLHYHPRHLLMTNVEFDHADIYNSIEDVIQSFTRLVECMPPDGCIVYCKDSPLLTEIVHDAACPVVSYSESRRDADWRCEYIGNHDGMPQYNLMCREKIAGRFSSKLMGRHNALNVTGVLALIQSMGLEIAEALSFLPEFSGAERRMQIRTTGDVTLIDDFAHHPTEINATLSAIKDRWPSHRVWALYEPKTQTSRRSVFQDETAGSLMRADGVLILEPEDVSGILPESRIDISGLCDTIRSEGTQCHSFSSIEMLIHFLVPRLNEPNTIIVLMSAGSFHGLGAILEREIVERKLGSPI